MASRPRWTMGGLVVGIVAGAILGLSVPANYVSVVTVEITPHAKTPTIVQLAKSVTLTDSMLSDLKLEPSQVPAQVFARQLVASSLIEVRASSGSPGVAQQLAEDFASRLIQKVNGAEVSAKAPDQAVAQLVEAATPAQPSRTLLETIALWLAPILLGGAVGYLAGRVHVGGRSSIQDGRTRG